MKISGAVSKAIHIPEALSVPAGVDGILRTVKSKATTFFPVIFLIVFAAGIMSGAVSDRLSSAVNQTADTFIDG